MRFEALLTDYANRDLEDIYSYVAEHDAAGKAEDLLDRIEGLIASLSRHPDRARRLTKVIG